MRTARTANALSGRPLFLRYYYCMTEKLEHHEHYERNNPELDEIADHLETISEALGFTESDRTKEARASVMAGIPAGGWDGRSDEHRSLLAWYYEAAEEQVNERNTPEVAIGYQVALAKLWLELDAPERFYDVIGPEDETGLITMLENTPGCEAYLTEVWRVLGELEMLHES